MSLSCRCNTRMRMSASSLELSLTHGYLLSTHTRRRSGGCNQRAHARPLVAHSAHCAGSRQILSRSVARTADAACCTRKHPVGIDRERIDRSRGEWKRHGASTPASPNSTSAAKDAQRYFTYLIGIVENADSSQSLALTIALKRANTPEALTALIAPFHSSLEKIVGKEEAHRLMGKLPAYQ